MVFLSAACEFIKALSPRIWLMISYTAVALSVLGYVHHNDKKTCELDNAKKTIEGVKIHDRIENKVFQLSDPDLDKRLAHWLRD